MRRTPAAIAASLPIVNSPSWPVLLTWVPPQTSIDFPEVPGSQRVAVKVEAEMVGTNERSFLANPFADYLVQCPMKQVSCCVICFNEPAPRNIGPQSDFFGHTKFSFRRKA